MLHFFRLRKTISNVENYVSHEKKKEAWNRRAKLLQADQGGGQRDDNGSSKAPCSTNLLWLPFKGKKCSLATDPLCRIWSTHIAFSPSLWPLPLHTLLDCHCIPLRTGNPIVYRDPPVLFFLHPQVAEPLHVNKIELISIIALTCSQHNQSRLADLQRTSWYSWLMKRFKKGKNYNIPYSFFHILICERRYKDRKGKWTLETHLNIPIQVKEADKG